jgi:hypothetical protein
MSETPLYSVGTWCTRRQAYSPQKGVPSINLTLAELRHSLRKLKRLGYGCYYVRDANGSHEDCNDPMVLVERTDGASPREIREGWKRPA